MTEANPLAPTRREILLELTEEFRKTQRAIRNLQTEKRQIQVSRIRNEKALEKLERQINEQEDRLENAQKEPDKQENARQALERLWSKKQQLLDEQDKSAEKPDELDNRIQEMEQKKTIAQKKIAELENYLTRQLFNATMSRLAFFFMAMGLFFILIGLAGTNWHGSINLGVSLDKQVITDDMVSSITKGISTACDHVFFSKPTCKGVKKGIVTKINSQKWKKDVKNKIKKIEEDTNEKVGIGIRNIVKSVAEFLTVIGVAMFIIFGACWAGLERIRMLNLSVTVEN